MPLTKYKGFVPGDIFPAVNADSIDPDSVIPQTSGYLTGGTGHSALSVFQTLARKTSQLLSNNGSSIWGTSGQLIVQSFITDSSGYVNNVYLSLSRPSAYPVSTNSTLSIFLADGNDRPTGSALASANKTQESISTTESFQRFGFNVQLNPNTKYCLVYSFPFDNSSYGIIWYYQNSNVYTGGIMSTYNGSAWTSFADRDLKFYIDSPADNDGKFSANIDEVQYDNVLVDLFKLSSSSLISQLTRTGSSGWFGFFATYSADFKHKLDYIRVAYNSYAYVGRTFKIRVRQNNSSGAILCESETVAFTTNSSSAWYNMNFTGSNSINLNPGQTYYFESVLISGTNDQGFISDSNSYRAFDLYGMGYDVVSSISDIANSVQTAIRNATGKTETVIYDTNKFKITSSIANRTSKILKLTSPSTGTDISGSGATPYLDLGTNATETHGTGDEYRLVRLNNVNKLPDEIIQKPSVIASDVLQAFANTERSETSTTYVKKKEILINRNGVIRVKFDLRSSSSTICYGRVYKNGTAVGVERSTGSSYVTYSEDFSVVQGDLIQLYAKASSGQTCWIKNFQVFYTENINTVNTD